MHAVGVFCDITWRFERLSGCVYLHFSLLVWNTCYSKKAEIKIIATYGNKHITWPERCIVEENNLLGVSQHELRKSKGCKEFINIQANKQHQCSYF